MSPRISIRLLATQPDERLIVLAREGHERAFEALVRRYRRPLLRYCQRLRLSDARAEDVVQQALMKAWLALANGAEVREPRAWLYRIVHNTAVNTIRATREVPTELAGVLGEQAPAESELERTLAVRDALGHVAELPRMQREAIFLTAVDGQSHDEVATALGVSQGAVRGLLYRARTTLRGATAALTPTPLLAWAARGAETSAPSAERIAELTGGAGAAGIVGALAKGAVVAVSVGALATGVAVVKLHHGAGSREHARDVARLASAGERADDQAASAAQAASPQAGSSTALASRAASGSTRARGTRPRRGARHTGLPVAPGGVGGQRRLLADAHPVSSAPRRGGAPSPGDGTNHDEPSGSHDGKSPVGPAPQLASGEPGRSAHVETAGAGSGEQSAQSLPPPAQQPPGSEASGGSGAGSEASRSDDGHGEASQSSSTGSDHSDDGEEAPKEVTGSGEPASAHGD